jgi:hypothetical protein
MGTDIDAPLHPARAFKHPVDVVRDSDLTLYEKRAILSSWASDACAVEDFPELRQAPSAVTVKFDEIMDALRELDSELERRVRPDRHIGPSKGSGPHESGDVPPPQRKLAISASSPAELFVVARRKSIISGDSISSDDFGAFLGAGTGRSRRS